MVHALSVAGASNGPEQYMPFDGQSPAFSCACSHLALCGVPVPLPTPQGRRAQQLRTMPKREIRMLRKATRFGCGTMRYSGHGGN